MVKVYLPGVKKKKWYTPSRSVLALCTVPLAVSLISTSASGTTASLGSLTTPVNPPEVVVCAFNAWGEQSTSKEIARTKITDLSLME